MTTYSVQGAHQQIVRLHAQLAQFAQVMITNRDLRHCAISSVTFKDNGWRAPIYVGRKP